MVILRRGLSTQASPTRPLLSTRAMGSSKEKAKEAALKKVVRYGQKIAAWERSIQAKADAKKAEEKAGKKKATKKATLKEARNKVLLEKGPLETEEGCPPDHDLVIRATSEPIEEPPHGRNDDLQGGDLQG